jgi:hypothetical protein
MKYFYFFFIIGLAGCSTPNNRTAQWQSYYNNQWMYEKSYSQKVHESNVIANQRRRNNDNKFSNMVPPGDPDEVIAVSYQFENYNGLTQEDQRRVAASDAYGSTNGVGIKVGQIYTGGPSQYQQNMNGNGGNNNNNNNSIYEREPVNNQRGEFEALYNSLNNN